MAISHQSLKTVKNGKTGILLTNLGTPSAPTPLAVKKYLAEFLSDPAVIKLPRWLWLPLLHGVILRKRPQLSAQLYEKIWTTQGSPLLVYSQQLKDKLQDQLSIDHEVVLGMRYGEPTLEQALLMLKEKNIHELIVLPLYPQYSYTTTDSTFKKIQTIVKKINLTIPVNFIRNYFNHPFYINTLSSYINQKRKNNFLILSFHGLPLRATQTGDPYESQCHETAQLLAESLNLSPQQWSIAFQSRFGWQKWLQPYCAELLKSLPQQGINAVDITCPGFPVDCLETLEEIAQQYQQVFYDAGGKDFNYIPSLNAEDAHAEMLKNILIDWTEKRNLTTY